MPNREEIPDLSQIRGELHRLITESFGGNVHKLPDDVPILDLGVSSLALVEGMRRVYDQFGVLVSIRRMIEGQVTLGGLALYIEQDLRIQQSARKRAQVAAHPWKTERGIPLADSQQYIHFLSRYSNEASAAYNEALMVRLNGDLHAPAIQAAIEEAGNRYDALRTALDPDHNLLNLGTGEPLELAVSQGSTSNFEPLLSEVIARPFEIGRRLFRAELLRLSETDHVLVLVGHSLLLDHQALIAVVHDIADLYQAFSQDQDPVPPPPTLQWSDYLAMGETSEARVAHQKAEEYWKGIFSSGVPRLELPADLPRPPIKKYSGASQSVQIDQGSLERLRNWASKQGVGFETLIFAGFTVFLHRLTNQKELVVGFESEAVYPDAGMQAIAPARNFLPIKTSLDPDTRFKDHFQTLKSLIAEAQAHRHLSFAELIKFLDLERDQSRSPLFTTAFRFWNDTREPVFNGLSSTFGIQPSPWARYDLELIVVTRDSGAWLVCDFSTELFKAETISRWLKEILSLAAGAVEEEDQACGLLPMMDENERLLVLYHWNATEKDYARGKTVLDLILEQVQIQPEHIAVRTRESSFNYEQLTARMEAIALTLVSKGVKRGDRVGVMLKRSIDLIPALLAVWRVGGLYVPMDMGFPKQRLSYMQAAAEIQTVLTHREVLSGMDMDSKVEYVCVEDIYGHNGSVLERSALPEGSDSAIILFTSGSTGKPKGVEIRHGALLNCLLATREYLEFTPQSSMLALTTISFDISTNELLMPLISGGCVDLGEDGLVADGLGLVERIEAHRPSHVQATASTWKSILTAGWKGDENIHLVSTGEALNRDLAEGLLQKCGALWNFYGPTETTVFSSAYKVVSEPGRPMRIGRPLPNTQMYVLDSRFQPVPIGAIGDLYIGGDGVAPGYWQKPELTHERFINNPFRSGERIYHTGDLARYLEDGTLICLGRSDDQVKIHAVRVELGEVESALRAVPGVRDAVVVSWKDARGDSQLVAHIIPEKELRASEIRTTLRERLPEVMVPPHILFTRTFPQTANGKVHRAALPPPQEADRGLAGAQIEPPSTSTEKILSKAWSNLLEIDEKVIGRDSDFLDLGGHSLLMTLLMLEVRKLFQVSFNLREFFSASTLRKFAALIEERQRQNAETANQINRPHTGRNAEWARQRMAFLSREAELPQYIAPARGLTFDEGAPINKVFLTGATGFLGAYIVAEILNTSNADLFCLVRPRRGENSKLRIENQMRSYGVWQKNEAWQHAWDSRIHIVEGDVTLPRMGVPDGMYETLAREIDTIFNGAAHVNFIYPYEALRATNVLGLHEIIQFAFHARIKQVHHLSTAAIWPMGSQYSLFEKDSIDHNKLLNLGYDEAKWVGEKVLLHAAERGLPVARYRPGEVGGDSVSGHCVTDHFLIACVKGFLQFGAFPQMDIEVDVAPVDYVAKAMVYLAFNRKPLGRAFHLTNPTRRTLKESLSFLRKLGYRFEEIPFEDLRDRLVASPDFASNALFAYQAALEDMNDVSMQLPTYDTREAQRELKGSGIVCAPADEKLFETYFNYLRGSGFMPAPDTLTAWEGSHA